MCERGSSARPRPAAPGSFLFKSGSERHMELHCAPRRPAHARPRRAGPRQVPSAAAAQAGPVRPGTKGGGGGAAATHAAKPGGRPTALGGGPGAPALPVPSPRLQLLLPRTRPALQPPAEPPRPSLRAPSRSTRRTSLLILPPPARIPGLPAPLLPSVPTEPPALLTTKGEAASPSRSALPGAGHGR